MSSVVGGSGGFLLAVVTESFAVRALLGSLAAAALAAGIVRLGLLRSRRARRLLVLTPLTTSGIAGVASVGEAFLPQIWVAAADRAGMLEVLVEQQVVSAARVEVLVLVYGLVAGFLLSRRAAGLLAVRRLLRRGTDGAGACPALAAMAHRLAGHMHLPAPRLVLLPACPGGAFTVGVVRPVVAIDPALLRRLDARELEGLLAHELAHVRRRDTLLAGVVGVGRDLTFFLPPVHLAARWLRKEQEESADELASSHTKRPVALASSILKVWDDRSQHGRARVACAAVPALRPALAGGGVLRRDAGMSDGARAIAARVERLIARIPEVSRGRRRMEVVLALAVTAAGTGAALLVPAWISHDLGSPIVGFGTLTPPALQPESPAFATFRELTPPAPTVSTVSSGDAAGAADGRAVPAAVERLACPCVESLVEVRQRVAAAVPASSPSMVWGDGAAWELAAPGTTAVRSARPLWTLSDAGPRLGFFVVDGPRL